MEKLWVCAVGYTMVTVGFVVLTIVAFNSLPGTLALIVFSCGALMFGGTVILVLRYQTMMSALLKEAWKQLVDDRD